MPPVSADGLRVAVIGLGRMGMRHVQVVRQMGMNVVGGADTSAAALAGLCRAYGVPEAGCYTDGMALLEVLRPQAVVIATTAPTHAPFVLAAAAAGVRHVLCEKPMASSLADAAAMGDACAARGVTLAVNHQMRFMPQYTEIKALIGSDVMGPLSSVIVAGSNFGLAMNASHYFEMLRFVGGASVHDVQAWFEPDVLANPRGPQFTDHSGRLLARTTSGVPMFIDFSAAAGWGLQVTYICRNGQITVDELTGELRVAARQAEHRSLPTTRYGMPADIRTVQIPPADVIAPTVAVWQAMLAGAGYPDGAAGAHALRCLVAAHASHRRGGVAVRLDDPDLPVDEVFAWA